MLLGALVILTGVLWAFYPTNTSQTTWQATSVTTTKRVETVIPEQVNETTDSFLVNITVPAGDIYSIEFEAKSRGWIDVNVTAFNYVNLMVDRYTLNLNKVKRGTVQSFAINGPKVGMIQIVSTNPYYEGYFSGQFTIRGYRILNQTMVAYETVIDTERSPVISQKTTHEYVWIGIAFIAVGTLFVSVLSKRKERFGQSQIPSRGQERQIQGVSGLTHRQ